MHILILPSWYPPQGGDFFRIQAEKIREQGNKVGVIYLEEYSIKDFFKKKKLQKLFIARNEKENLLQVIRIAWVRLPQVERLNLHIRVIFYKKLLKRYIARMGRPDIIHSHSTLWGGYFCYRLKNNYGIPYVITEHRGRFNVKNKLPSPDIRYWFKPYLSKALLNAGKVICVTKYHIPFFMAQSSSLKAEKFIEIPNLFESNFSKQELLPKTENRPFTLLNLAIFSGYKNHSLLISCIETLVKLGLTNILVFLAGDGELKKKYEQIVIERKLSDFIKFMGFCNQQKLIELFNLSDFMILSSLSEAQPVAILESFAMGTPVIVPDIITSSIVNETNGITYKTGDLDDMVQKLLQAIETNKQFNRDKLREFALNNFSDKAIIPQIIRVYNEVLKK